MEEGGVNEREKQQQNYSFQCTSPWDLGNENNERWLQL